MKYAAHYMLHIHSEMSQHVSNSQQSTVHLEQGWQYIYEMAAKEVYIFSVKQCELEPMFSPSSCLLG